MRVWAKAAGSRSTHGDIIAAVHRHEDARPVDGLVDMDLHSHVTVINAMRRSDVQWTSINNDQGVDCELQKEADTVYLATLARLAVEHGHALEQSATGFEVAGITREQIEAFSRRRGQIQQDLADKGGIEAASVAQRDAAWTTTRAEKRQRSEAEQGWEWRQRLREAQVPVQELRMKSLERAQVHALPDPDRTAKAVQRALEHCSEQQTVFSRRRPFGPSACAKVWPMAFPSRPSTQRYGRARNCWMAV
jgi:hypothetical protein